MEPLVLHVGSKWLSSWSLRPYLALVHTGAPFEERVVTLYQDRTATEIKRFSPSGKVPCLHHGSLVVWDSLAICEYLAELFPAAQLWPADRAARAHARSISAEMHAGFAQLRTHLSMDLKRDHSGEGHTPEALADAARVMEIWRDCRARAKPAHPERGPEGAESKDGPFLFGAFSIADAMFAPVTTRFTTSGVPMDEVSAAYVAAIAALPGMKAWRAAARAE
jgi:glutathione S-transferase